MKIREGFVSNSSSSSYVLLGCKLSEDEIAQKLGINVDDVYEKLDDLGLFQDSDDDVVGHIIVQYYSDGDFDDGINISMAELMKLSNDIATKLSVPVEEIKLLSGIRSC